MTKFYKLDGAHFYNAMVCGALEVMENKLILNKINVFPVADGDTGSNLSATMTSILEHMKKSENLSVVANTAAEGALLGARGNSGIIFAQFLYGFHMAVENEKEIDSGAFILAMKTSLARLYEVVMSPVEGTILTLITSWISAMERHHLKELHFKAFVSITMKESLEALERTTEQLPILKEKGVVDSGAKGFYLFLEGVSQYLVTGNVPQIGAEIRETSLLPEHKHSQDLEISENRFCCEAVVNGHKMDVLQVKRTMSGFGDSLVIAGGGERIRLHMHTNTPESMFSQLQTFGKLSQIKADDMHLQMEAIQEPRSKIAIVTDSIADLPEGFARKNQVFVMPMQMEVDGVVHLDRISLSAKRFYEINRHLKEQPTSSLPSIKQVESLLQFLQEHYEAVLVLCVSDQLSGTYEMVASLAALQRKRGQKIAVVNTLKNSGAQGLLVVEACKLARQKISLEAMVAQLDVLIPRTQILVAVDTVKYLERSGRVSHNVGKIAKWMNLKPIMTLDKNGKGKAYGGTISYNSVILKIKKAILKDQQRYGIESFNIVHGACLERAEKLSKEMEKMLGMPAAYIAEISPIVGAIAGEGAVAVSYICTKSRE